MQVDEAQQEANAVDRKKKMASLLRHLMMRMNREMRVNKMRGQLKIKLRANPV
jgi:hypothetical protein